MSGGGDFRISCSYDEASDLLILDPCREAYAVRVIRQWAQLRGIDISHHTMGCPISQDDNPEPDELKEGVPNAGHAHIQNHTPTTTTTTTTTTPVVTSVTLHIVHSKYTIDVFVHTHVTTCLDAFATSTCRVHVHDVYMINQLEQATGSGLAVFNLPSSCECRWNDPQSLFHHLESLTRWKLLKANTAVA
jgi:hypothetical protein